VDLRQAHESYSPEERTSAAARLYWSVDFEKVEARHGRQWGVCAVEEKYVLALE
jgi:hypothetical protein